MAKVRIAIPAVTNIIATGTVFAGGRCSLWRIMGIPPVSGQDGSASFELS
jgi:hypothetical protein